MRQAFTGALRGYPNKRWPAWFRPTLVELPAVPFGSVPRKHAAHAGRRRNPGAGPGPHPRPDRLLSSRTATTPSSSLATAPTPRTLCCAAVVDGVGPDEAAERLTHERIRAYAAVTPTVYLPAHDPETAARLAARRPIGAAREKVIA